jgi:hypothetical protein
MSQSHRNSLALSTFRRRRERLIGALAGVTLALSWYLAAALDAQAEQRQHGRHARPSAFDTAFMAANQGTELLQSPCVERACWARVAQVPTPSSTTL